MRGYSSTALAGDAPQLEASKARSELDEIYPDYYIIDRKGVLRWADFANGDVEKAIEFLLAEK
jgi:hypothetical protein